MKGEKPRKVIRIDVEKKSRKEIEEIIKEVKGEMKKSEPIKPKWR